MDSSFEVMISLESGAKRYIVVGAANARAALNATLIHVDQEFPGETYFASSVSPFAGGLLHVE